MGSPLSPVLAGLFMEYFESELLPTLPVAPPLWLRYVDDIFMIWRNDDDFAPFLSAVNELVPSIKFTVEWEDGAMLPFLDLKVFRHNGSYRFDIYRKPTHAGNYLHNYSWQPKEVKH